MAKGSGILAIPSEKLIQNCRISDKNNTIKSTLGLSGIKFIIKSL